MYVSGTARPIWVNIEKEIKYYPSCDTRPHSKNSIWTTRRPSSHKLHWNLKTWYLCGLKTLYPCLRRSRQKQYILLDINYYLSKPLCAMLLCLQLNSTVLTTARGWLEGPRQGSSEFLRARHEYNLFKYGLNVLVGLPDIWIKMFFDPWNELVHPWGLEVRVKYGQRRYLILSDLS